MSFSRSRVLAPFLSRLWSRRLVSSACSSKSPPFDKAVAGIGAAAVAFTFGSATIWCDVRRRQSVNWKETLAHAIDADGDGNISLDEINAFFPKVDVNNDGSISFDELYTYLHKSGQSLQAMSRLKEAYKEIDADNSGGITKEELFYALQDAPTRYPIVAECAVSPGGNPGTSGCHGIVRFTQTCANNCKIEWDLEQCGKIGLHGFHVHEKADFSNCCLSAGPHYNPFLKDHGGPDDENRHVGDMGNVTVDRHGKSKGSLVDKLIKLYGETSIIGRSVMIHEDPDDLGRGDNSQPGVNGKTSKTTGNAGARIACGEIKLV